MALFHKSKVSEPSAEKFDEWINKVRVFQEERKAWGGFGGEGVKNSETKNMATLCLGIEGSS